METGSYISCTQYRSIRAANALGSLSELGFVAWCVLLIFISAGLELDNADPYDLEAERQIYAISHILRENGEVALR